MRNVDGPILKRAIGLVIIFVSILVVLGYSALGNLPSASAVVSLQPQEINLQHVPTGTANLVWDAKQQTRIDSR